MKLKNSRRAVALGASTATLAAGLTAFGVVHANAADNSPLDVVLGVGASQSEKVVSWYYPDSKQQAIQLEEGKVTSFDDKARTIVAKSAKNETTDTAPTESRKVLDDAGATSPATPGDKTGYYNSHVNLHDLKPATYYTYRVGASDGSSWSDTYTFFTGTTGKDFKFAFFGDPQIGSSGYSENDGRGWAQTLEYLKAHDTDTELLVSGGDQVEAANNEYDWQNWADPKKGATGTATSNVLKEYTWAPTIGNHEGAYSEGSPVGATGRAYMQHFFPPNVDEDARFYRTGTEGTAPNTYAATTANRPGGDYWYVYKDVLFIDLNSNAYAGSSDAAHVQYVTDVIKNHGTGTKWQVLVYHHSIYSPADHANDADNKQRAADFTTAFSNLGVDLVLQGHDHAYSRSYALKNGQKANKNEQPGATSVAPGPGGVIYVTADSSSGSKFYDLTAPDTTKRSDYPADPDSSSKNDANQARHYANSVESQQYVPSYIKVQVANGQLQVTDLATGSCADATNSAVFTNKAGQRKKADGTTYGDTELCSLGDQRPEAATDVHHLQKAGAVIDGFVLKGGNNLNLPPAEVKEITKTVIKTVTKEVVPARLKATVAAKITKLNKQIRRAHGTQKSRLKAELAAYRAIQKQLG